MTEIDVDEIEFITDAEVYPNYSGRGMYGRTCVGIVFDHVGEFAAFVKELTEQIVEDEYDPRNPLFELFQRIDEVSTDSMGLGTIYYWRGLQAKGKTDD